MMTAASITKLTKNNQVIEWSSIATYMMSVQLSSVITRKSESSAMPRLRQWVGSWSRKRCTPRDRVDIEDRREQQHHVAQPGRERIRVETMTRSCGTTVATRSTRSRRAKPRDEGELACIRHEGEDQDDEVEEVPAVLEIALEAGRDGGELDRGFDHEDGKGRVEGPLDGVAEVRVERLARFQTEAERGYQDHRDDQAVERRRGHNARAHPFQSVHVKTLP